MAEYFERVVSGRCLTNVSEVAGCSMEGCLYLPTPLAQGMLGAVDPFCDVGSKDLHMIIASQTDFLKTTGKSRCWRIISKLSKSFDTILHKPTDRHAAAKLESC